MIRDRFTASTIPAGRVYRVARSAHRRRWWSWIVELFSA
jgi:hypothetical protein